MVTIVNTPASVSTVSYRRLVAHTLDVVQPDKPAAVPVAISNYRSSVPEINAVKNTTRYGMKIVYIWRQFKADELPANMLD